MNLVQERLKNQHLLQKDFKKPQEVVSWLGAVQSQDYLAAKWTLGLRMSGASDLEVERDFNDGKFLRTHVMRPTWHFVTPEDIRWMLKLTGPNVTRVMSSYNRKLELTEEVFAKSRNILIKTLRGGKQLTRADLKQALENVGIQTDVQRLAHLVMQSELEGLICSGPRIGKQFTYQLLEERVPKTKDLNREESLARLASKYFQSHGPAQVQDFSWWSGLSKKEALEGLVSVKTKMVSEKVDEKIYWFFPNKNIEKIDPIPAFLMSIYEEYTIAYKDRSALGDDRIYEKLISMGNALTSVVVLNGKIVGTWKRTIGKTTVEIKINALRRFDEKEQSVLKKAAENYGQFLKLPVSIFWQSATIKEKI